MKRCKNKTIIRKKMALGGPTGISSYDGNSGTINYGSEITADDISNKEVGAIGNTALSTAGGVASGALIGASVSGPLAPIGAVVGGLVGLIGGLFGSRKRKEQKAAMLEAQRQQTLANMNQKFNTDIATIQNQDLTGDDYAGGYYAKYGGKINARIRYATGGIVRNSSNSKVAYGATHEQVNSQYGGTGVPYQGIEVEGGGDNNGILYPGEVIIDKGQDAFIFSDKIKVPNTNNSFADVAKKLTDRKGVLEDTSTTISGVVANLLNDININKTNRLKLGTTIRNTEKMVSAMNIIDGKTLEIDKKINNLYNEQERIATEKGLRDNTNIARCGGRKRKYLTGGGIMRLNAGLNLINALSTNNAINFEERLQLPIRSTVEAPIYNSRYNITNQLQGVTSEFRNASEYIKANTSNPQIARSAIGSLSARAAQIRGSIYDTKNKAESEMYDRNINARYQTDVANREIAYNNAMNQYAKQVDINSKRAANRQQLYQGIANSGQDYLNWKTQIYGVKMNSLTHASPSITKEMNDFTEDFLGNDKIKYPKWIQKFFKVRQ